MRFPRLIIFALSAALALGVTGGLAQGQPAPRVPPERAAVARWPGQQPGKMYLGMSCGTVCPERATALGQPFGVHRQFEGWGHWGDLARDIQADHAANRLPWVSIKPPIGGPAGWRAIASGQYDAKLRQLAVMLKANDSLPVLLTFHHEPSNDGTEAQGAQWAAAYVHLHNLLRFNGALANVADPPIVGDWLFNPRNHAQNPSNWITPAVLKRAPFLGIDLYENAGGETFAQRLPRVLDWMAAQGYPHKMVGIGETGSTDMYRGTTAVKWMRDSLGWAANHPNEVGVVSYFNSTANSRAHVYWPLNESVPKMKLFRALLNHRNVVS